MLKAVVIERPDIDAAKAIARQDQPGLRRGLTALDSAGAFTKRELRAEFRA